MRAAKELRIAPLGLRIRPSVKKALKKAATDDNRTVASLVEKIAVEWLEEKGYLK